MFRRFIEIMDSVRASLGTIERTLMLIEKNGVHQRWACQKCTKQCWSCKEPMFP